jgi:hypothetical protein
VAKDASKSLLFLKKKEQKNFWSFGSVVVAADEARFGFVRMFI